MAILGLIDAETFSVQRFKNIRRSVFYFYPNGAATLTGIMSMVGDEVTNDPEFKWFEKRLAEQRTLTVQANAAGPFTATGTDTDLTAAGWSATAGTNIRVRTVAAGTDVYRVGHVIKISNVATTTTPIEIKGIITSLPASNRLEVRLLENVTNALNTVANNGLEILVIGSSFAEGIVDISSAIYNLPTEIGNYTQIFRTPFTISGTALKTSARFDETGVYRDMAKEHSVYNMIEIERSIMFGTKTLYTGGATPSRTTGGILWFLQQWESGTVYNNTAATLDSDDNKRIIANASGVMAEKTYDGLVERVFRVTNNNVNEKLVFCGSGFLSVINQLYKTKAVLNADLPMGDTYGMNVVKHVSPFGTLYYKTHPLFTQNPTLRYNALFLDIQNLKYRYVNGRDTELLTGREPNDADYRKDEWLTECGLELRFPESHMYLQNVRDYAP
jgi:Family of unknown function (DUF5309)